MEKYKTDENVFGINKHMEKLVREVLTSRSVTTHRMQKKINILSIKNTMQLSDIRAKLIEKLSSVLPLVLMLQKCLTNGHFPVCLKSAKRLLPKAKRSGKCTKRIFKNYITQNFRTLIFCNTLIHNTRARIRRLKSVNVQKFCYT